MRIIVVITISKAAGAGGHSRKHAKKCQNTPFLPPPLIKGSENGEIWHFWMDRVALPAEFASFLVFLAFLGGEGGEGGVGQKQAKTGNLGFFRECPPAPADLLVVTIAFYASL